MASFELFLFSTSSLIYVLATFHELLERDESRNALKILNKGIRSLAFIFTRDELDDGKVFSLNMYNGGDMSTQENSIERIEDAAQSLFLPRL